MTGTGINGAGYSDACEVLSFEANPNSGFSSPDMIFKLPDRVDPSLENTPNLVVLSNEADNVTTGVVQYPTLSKNCVLTINQQGSNSAYHLCFLAPDAAPNRRVFRRAP